MRAVRYPVITFSPIITLIPSQKSRWKPSDILSPLCAFPLIQLPLFFLHCLWNIKTFKISIDLIAILITSSLRRINFGYANFLYLPDLCVQYPETPHYHHTKILFFLKSSFKSTTEMVCSSLME